MPTRKRTLLSLTPVRCTAPTGQAEHPEPQSMKIYPSIQQIAYHAPTGRSITLCEIENGKGLERKNEWVLFSLKGLLPYNGKQSNSSLYSSAHPAGLSDPRERARDKNSKPTHLHTIAWITVLCSGIVYGINEYVFSAVQYVMRENKACIIPLI